MFHSQKVMRMNKMRTNYLNAETECDDITPTIQSLTSTLVCSAEAVKVKYSQR